MQADGVTRKGKTDTKKVGSGGTDSIQKGKHGNGGVSNKALKAVGRNLARANNQKG